MGLNKKITHKKRVLVCPLDWGLGHASRDIAIIHSLLQQGLEVIIAADNLPLRLLQEEFPELPLVRFPSFTIRYAKKNILLKLILSIPKILWGTIKEHEALKKILKQHRVDMVISDNRYGLWNKKVRTVFITHQVMIKLPGLLKMMEYTLYRINRKVIEKFDECWIPDFAGGFNLSGDLSHKYPLPANAKYIGVLSRFKAPLVIAPPMPIHDILVILSGPEPQRSILENILLGQLMEMPCKAMLVRGLPSGKNAREENKNVTIVSHLSTPQMMAVIKNAAVVICRPGYTSIMDLVALGKKAMLIPTPGQTEQEYLALHLKKTGYFYTVNQNNINLKKALRE